MHDHVVRARKAVHQDSPESEIHKALVQRLEAGGLSRAMAAPLSQYFAQVHMEAIRWLRHAEAFSDGREGPEALGEILFASRHIHVVLQDFQGFVERAEDLLSQNDEVTHKETKYERDVSHFSKLESTAALRNALVESAGFEKMTAIEAGRLEGDLLKVVYLGMRTLKEMPKIADLHSMMMELNLDIRRHLMPGFEDKSEFMTALRKAADSAGSS